MTDWENREFVESIRLHMQRLAHYISDLDSKTRAHLAAAEQRLDVLERKLEQLDGGLDRASRKTGGDSAGDGNRNDWSSRCEYLTIAVVAVLL